MDRQSSVTRTAVGPRRVVMDVSACDDCGQPVYESPTAGLRGLRHVNPLGSVGCPTKKGEQDG